MTAIYDIPMPSPADSERSKTLTDLIKQEISHAGGSISFEQYMALTLYHPTLGYYNAESFRLGREGDFTTAPEISPVFAQTIARWFAEALKEIPGGGILEFGAGTGRFAGEALLALEQLGKPPQHYYIVEPNGGLRQQQEAFLSEYYPTQRPLVVWLDELPAGFIGVIFANEVLDALPIQLFKIGSAGVLERRVTWAEEQFSWVDVPADDQLNSAVAEISTGADLAEGYESEVNTSLPAFIKAAADCLAHGVILFADYGYGRPEYYRPQRNKGTLTCFYKHHHHDDPLIMPGLQDITAHVDFTSVAESGVANGLDLLGFTTQTGFLLDCGLGQVITAAEEKLDTIGTANLHQAVKTLTMPSEMGEIIKVMGLAKGVDGPNLGFRLQDRRRDL